MRTMAVKAAVGVTAAVLALAACSSSSSGSKSSKTAPGYGSNLGNAPIAGRTQPVKNTTGKHIKIALISFPAANEFFAPVKHGSDAANDVLKGQNAEVDYITVNDFTEDAVNAATKTAILQGYDAIGIAALDAGVCPVIKDATSKKIKTATFIITADCVQSAGALFFHGEDLYKAWKTLAVPALIKAIQADPHWQGKKCKVGVITGAFAVPAHELMRTAIIDGLKESNSGITPVSSGVEIQQDLAKVGPATKAYLAGNPTDLCGIAVDIGDAGAAASALTPAQAKHIKVMSADFTVGGVNQMQAGKQTILIGQDPFGESYDTAMMLYNAVVTGTGPGFYQPVKNSIMTPDNIDKLVSDQNNGVPASS
jgi:ribose transport system substrate-binding protein